MRLKKTKPDIIKLVSCFNVREDGCPVMSHLVWCSILLTAACGRLFVVLASVHHLSLGALSDQVSAHAGNIFETMTWQRNKRERKGEAC